ncbi:multiple monosaccharide ABC transporter permease [Aestuariivirga sp. YIM B02566]|uniref:Sugar ABC transporter permease n=1 Tax=Taklimakanibacter albus TaxID=2800327 RepID=A0ACC5R8F0_9HYPH|nr:multiple monosaccharide ABC transporter permease [Aestuariivirga sp. YIM B02566]MBK1868658.1 sugar ABC transporter permease [Aestuariivirga sp. YIM B02566]
MSEVTAQDHAKPDLLRFIKAHIRDYALLLSLLAIMVFFQFTTNGTLFMPVNMTNIILQNSYIVIMALGMLLVIVAGHIDLSVGSVSGFIGAVAAVMMVSWKLDPFVSVAACLALGALIGAVQGYFIAYHKIPAFIVTLAGMLIFKGLALTVLGGASVGPFPKEFQLLSSGYVPDIFGGSINILALLIGALVTAIIIYFNYRERLNQQEHGLAEEPDIIFYGRNVLIAIAFLGFSFLMARYKGLPNVLIVMFALIAFFVFVTTNTTMGRRIYAMGGNEKATKLSGIDTERLTFLIFVIMGALAALAGLIFAARLNVATPKAGLGFELDVIAACFIGGAATTGGVGKVIGAVIGAFIMGVMNNGMSIMGIGIDWQQVIKGTVLMLAVFLDVYYKNKAR